MACTSIARHTYNYAEALGSHSYKFYVELRLKVLPNKNLGQFYMVTSTTLDL